jgi:hypothetical protein
VLGKGLFPASSHSTEKKSKRRRREQAATMKIKH